METLRSPNFYESFEYFSRWLHNLTLFKLIFPVDGFQRVERNFEYRYPFFPTISVIKWNCKQTVVSLIIKISFCFEFFFLFLSREKLRFFLTRIPRFNIYKYWIDLIPFQSFMDSWFPSVYPSEYNLQTWTKATSFVKVIFYKSEDNGITFYY